MCLLITIDNWSHNCAAIVVRCREWSSENVQYSESRYWPLYLTSSICDSQGVSFMFYKFLDIIILRSIGIHICRIVNGHTSEKSLRDIACLTSHEIRSLNIRFCRFLLKLISDTLRVISFILNAQIRFYWSVHRPIRFPIQKSVPNIVGLLILHYSVQEFH